MPDITYNQFPISGKIVDFDTLQNDVNNLNANAVLENRTINGYDLSENRTIYAQDVPSKNLLPNTASSTSSNGVTVTVNADGSVTVSGTASANVEVDLYTFSASELASLSGCILSGCPSGGSQNGYNITLQGSNSPWTTYARDIGSGATISSGSAIAKVFIWVGSGTAISTPITFYPMIRPSTAPAGYVPYAKTNVELSKIESKTPSPVISRISSMTGVIHKSGEICHVNVKLTSNTTATNSPQVVTALPNAICDSALTAIDITSGIGAAITDAIPCGVSEGGVMYLQTITSGHIYAITGSYICK